MKSSRNIITLALTIIMICACAIPSYAMDIPEKDYPFVLVESPATRSPGGGYTEGTQEYYGLTMTGSLDANKISGAATTTYPSTTREKEVSISVDYENVNTGKTYTYMGPDQTITKNKSITVTWTRPSSSYEATYYMSTHHVQNNEGVPGIAITLPML